MSETAVATERTMFRSDDIRADFPLLQREINGQALVYLDNAATTQKPQAVIEALTRYYGHENANVHRGVHTLSADATAAYEGAREKVRAFINAHSSNEVIFTRGTTEAINLVAHSYGACKLRSGDEVLVGESEHHSNIVPWQILCARTGAKLKVAPINDAGELIFDAFASLLNERTKICALGHVSNALGTINPVVECIRHAREVGAVTVIDGAQAVAHMNVDVHALNCDFYAFSSHKLFGPTGFGVLYGRQSLLEEMTPYQSGGDMIRTVSFAGTEYNDPPHKFEAGTPHIAGAVGLGAAIDYVNEIDFAAALRHEHALLQYATDKALTIDGLRVVGTAREKCAVLSFLIDGTHPHDLGLLLDHQGIAIRTGHHCAMPVMERFGIEGTARASFSIYNRREDVDALMAGLAKARELLR